MCGPKGLSSPLATAGSQYRPSCLPAVLTSRWANFRTPLVSRILLAYWRCAAM